MAEALRMLEIDSALVSAWRRGEEAATRALFEAVYPYAVRMGALSGLPGDEARECAQDVFARAYERRLQLRDPQAFALWFHRILTRAILDRTMRRSRPRESSLESAGDTAEDWQRNTPEQPDQAAVDGELRVQIWRQVQRLEPRARLAITLRYFSDYSTREVAGALGIRHGAARTLLSRALARLRSFQTPETRADALDWRPLCDIPDPRDVARTTEGSDVIPAPR